VGDSSTDFWILVRPVFRPVLSHDIDVGADGQFLSDEPENSFCGGDPSGHNEVPDEKTPLCNPIRIDQEVPNLSMHFFKNLPDDLWIVRGITELLGISFVHEFDIRHVDVHDVFKQPYHLDRFVSGAVIDNREPKPFFNCFGKRGNDLGSIMGGSDKIDIMAAHPLESEHDPCQVTESDRVSLPLVGNVVVLAEDASQITMGEKDRSRAMISDQGRFLSEMGENAGGFHLCPGPAISKVSFEAIDPAFPRAESALV
jgi:hypothetical protein